MTTIQEYRDIAEARLSDYLDAYGLWRDRSRAYELQVVALMTDGIDCKEAWYRVLLASEGRDAMDMWRVSEIDKEKTKYLLEIAMCDLRGAIGIGGA